MDWEYKQAIHRKSKYKTECVSACLSFQLGSVDEELASWIFKA